MRTIITSLFLVLPAFTAPVYRLVDLGPVPNGSSGADVNNAGQIIGTVYSAGWQAFYWNGASTAILGSFGGVDAFGRPQTLGNGLNDSAQLVGHSLTLLGETMAFATNGSSLQPLGTLGGTYSSAAAINNSGQVAGTSTLANGWYRAFVWNGTMQDIGILSAACPQGGTSANDINNAGYVTGQSANAGCYGHAYLWNGSTMQDLGTFGGRFSTGYAVNSLGHVVGRSELPSLNGDVAFLWNGTSMQSLGYFPHPFPASGAFDINDSGYIVGYSNRVGFGGTAVLWEGGNMHVLNDLVNNLGGWNLTNAMGINNIGQITGSGYFNGQERAFLLTPVPEPATAGLVSISLGLIVLCGRTKRTS